VANGFEEMQKVCRILATGAVILQNMSANDLELLGRFRRDHSQDAFTELVTRYMNLVYSAALRQVRSPQLAEEVCQAVFTQLARNAAKLSPDTILTAWLYQVTRHTAIDVIRSEARRQAREQIAIQMSDMNETSANWSHIEPLLDEAMQSLDQTDRTAILLRYFESKSLREVGEAIGASEDAAQKRVQRAVERLREFLLQNKVKVSAAGLVALVAANAVQAAPSGLAVMVATGAMAASAATAVTITKAIAMTTLQKTVIAAVVTGAIGAGLYQARVAHNLSKEVQTLKQQQEQQAAMSQTTQQLQRERDGATAAQAALANEEAARKNAPNEVLKLRGEVGRLRHENAQIGSSNALSKATATPEARKTLREGQKVGMAMIYKGFAQQVKLSPEQTDKLNDLLADHIMKNVDHVTTGLRDKLSSEQMTALFTTEEAALQQKVEALVGPDGLAQYQDYTRNLLANLSAEQFKGMLSGTEEEKDQKSNQLRQLIQQEGQAALTRAGLPGDYQMVPMLNFSNIAFEQEGEQSLKLLGEVFQRAAAGANSFLSAAEIAKLQQFSAIAISNNRGALSLNRAIMAPISN
jgi:RNA polymerase sigma factor (sigma-70 family)